MQNVCTIRLPNPIASVKIISGVNAGADLPQAQLTEQTNAQKDLYDSLCGKLQSIIAKLDEYCNDVFAGHKEEIARLSVEIARKVLMQKIAERDYKLESIIKEAIENAPARNNLTIRLNPEDLALFQEAQKTGTADIFDGARFVADSNIGHAECMVESPKGIIKSLINGHLEEISKALKIAV
jgi:flagellar biosynthesis/type III secretory pathway protein FliH